MYMYMYMYIYVYIYIYKYTDTTGQSGHRVSRPRGTGSVGDSVGEGLPHNTCLLNPLWYIG